MKPNIRIPGAWFLGGCIAAALGIFFFTDNLSAGVIATEVFLTIIALFVFGSTRYELDKNALTYGAVIIIGATFATGWTPQSSPSELIHHYLLTLHGLDQLFHVDTMLFILGLTFFVAVVAQSRILESVSFAVLTKNKGRILPTVAILTALVSFASGILDGVSMIGLMIRTLVIILFLAKSKEEPIIFSVIVSTIITTVCGMWLAYGEPPNLIMKANLHPHLTNAFFLRYCLPVAIGTYFIVYFNLRKRLGKQKVDMSKLDSMDLHLADLRFFQVMRHGRILDTNELLHDKTNLLKEALENVQKKRIRAQWITGLSFIPFIGLLIGHAVNHRIPLFYASFAGFAVALMGIYKYKNIRKLAIHEAVHEYKEYLFLFPLFLSITLLQKSGFFDQMTVWLHNGIEHLGVAIVALIQFTGAVFLSALLDNNVVADFASRALHGLEMNVLHLFAMAQIAGYAAGGCWTHIGSAQSVVAFAFIKKEINEHYTPFQWIKAMTPIIIEIFILMVVVIYAEAQLAKLLH